MAEKLRPPFDDSAPCPACPAEVRGLYAVAFNLLNLRKDPDRWQRKIGERLDELQAAVDKMTPIIDAHFVNRAHSHGFEDI
jgi:hypothetical protein